MNYFLLGTVTGFQKQAGPIPQLLGDLGRSISHLNPKSLNLGKVIPTQLPNLFSAANGPHEALLKSLLRATSALSPAPLQREIRINPLIRREMGLAGLNPGLLDPIQGANPQAVQQFGSELTNLFGSLNPKDFMPHNINDYKPLNKWQRGVYRTILQSNMANGVRPAYPFRFSEPTLPIEPFQTMPSYTNPHLQNLKEQRLAPIVGPSGNIDPTKIPFIP